MKAVFGLAIAVFFVTGLAAQNEQETQSSKNDELPGMWLGGEVTFGSMSSHDLTIGPNWGMMLGERLGVGSTVTFSIGNSAYYWGLDPYVRYYLPVADQFSFYGDGFIGIGGGDNNTSFNGGYYTTFNFGARVGLQFWFTPMWSIAASTNILKYNLVDGTGNFGGGVNFNSVNFSFFFHF